MSLSKETPNCAFCRIGKGIYSCPRCNQKYCSSNCYKSQNHVECSESFFKEWVEQSLQQKSCDSAEKENMLKLLKRFEEEYTEDPVSNDFPLEERFAGINIHDADENVIWQNLNVEEKKKFETFLEDEKKLAAIVPVKQPWWTNTTLNLVEEADSETIDLKDDVASRPPYPLNIKKLSDLTSIQPSDCIKFNLVNVLYSYTFLFRFYNCDLRDFREDVVDYMFVFSPVLSEGKNYFSLEEVIQDSIRLISSSEFGTSLTFVKSVINDVGSIMQGPNNAKSSTFVLCALHDIKLLFLELKYANKERKDVDKSFQKKLLFAMKKIEYFMSWCLDFESTISDIASEAVLLILPELLPVKDKCEPQSEDNKKPLIEELD
ncbi:zinc finger HIT domain-containing protein 2-like [Argiope bruennichi]|uniref:Zinc finger HIT domain-containing protein 2 n=1 Tax=Argiope bruennichi TaxID=94029 RepID=A0A8T0F7T1_ARGBR|nr:zinc finger HIT domain-containing protein 2-like [Argiope bruennichi]KAF8787264.1 Zinc finger HIT domain-containing protein 2 [Argiope bruennichi]